VARNFSEMFERLKVLLLAESEALRVGGATDLAANADSKARILLELAQWRSFGDQPVLTNDDAKTIAALLNDNANLLKRHMDAANRVSSTLAQHLRDADSDGTYGSGYGQLRRSYAA
jgi:hypothetical protein